MTFEKNFADLKKLILKVDAKKLEGQFAFQFSIEGDGEGVFYFELKDGALFVEPYTYNNCTATFKATAATFKALLGGKVSASDAIAKGDLKVEGNVASCADIFNSYMKKTPAKKETKAAAKAPAKKEAKPVAKAPAKKETKAPAKATAKKEAKPAVKKEAPKAAVKTEVKAAPKAEVKTEAKVAPKAEIKTEAKVAPKAEVKTEAKPAPKAEVKTEAKAAPKAEAKPVAKTAPKTNKSTKKARK